MQLILLGLRLEGRQPVQQRTEIQDAHSVKGLDGASNH